MTMVHHPSNDLLLEFEDSAVTTMSLSHLSLDLMPGMVKSSSLGSLSADGDSDSSSVRSQSPLYNLSSPRAIFDTYWSATSPSSTRRKRGVISLDNKATTLGEDEEVLARLQATLRLPSMIDDENDETVVVPEPQSQDVRSSSNSTPVKMVRPPSSRDDTLVDYQASLAKAPGSHSTRRTRRQILPSPPPPPSPHTAAVSPSLYIPPSSSPLVLPREILSCQSSVTPSWWFGMRPWSSTSALHAKQPSQSCLRKSRYSSFSGTLSPTSSSSYDDDDKYQNRSVSFYSRVSVLEFTVPQEKRSQEGWSKYFV